MDKFGRFNFLKIYIPSFIFFHLFFYFNPAFAPTIQKREDASGFSHFKAQNFAPYFYEKGLFPVVKIDSIDDFFPSRGAENLAKQKGSILLMEFEHWSRLGENARVIAFLPDAFLYGTKQPSIITFNALLFVFVLCFMLFRWRNTRFFPYVIVISIIFSITPYYLYEVYANENTFYMMGTLYLFVFSLNYRVFDSKSNTTKWILYALISGIALGFFNEIRGELKVLLISVGVLYFFSSYLSLIQKILALAMLGISFYLSVFMIRAYFDSKWEEAENYIIENEGYVYTGGKIPSHKFWHPVFCGLGDFGTDKGYVWDDKVAYRYALPILEQRLHQKLHYSDRYHLDEYYDKDSIYYQKFDEIEDYEQIMKEKVMSDIQSDKSWYFLILIKRTFQIMKDTTPIPYLGYLLFPLLILLAFFKRKQWLVILLSTLPLSLNSLIIYSKDGSALHGMFGMMIASLVLLIIIEKLITSKGFSLRPPER